jgi:serine/threonine protein kinase
MQEVMESSLSSFENVYINNNELAASTKKKKITLESFNMLSLIGKGTYAKVILVRKKDDGQIFALKILKKSYI